jgi:signal transduction histidine kinase
MARILVVEDNPVMADAIRDVLQFAGHEVTIAPDGRAGLEAIPKVTPELIISDVMMPRMDGFQFYQHVRANPAWVFIPFIFLTARGQEEDIMLGKRLGADDYLVKPCEAEELLAVVDSKLVRARALSRAAGLEMDKIKRTITQVIGHELRTPLTWISGYAELLLGELENISPEELHRSLESIKAGSERLARLVEDAVLVVSLDSGQAKEDFDLTAKVEANLSLYVEQVLDRLRPQAKERRVRLEMRVPEDLPPVLLAARFFSEALIRLVDNGIKFARQGVDSYVIVSAQDKPDEIEFIVSDNGVGIPASELERIFEPLVQVRRAEMEQQGVGLGLTVARGLIQLHGGRMWAESRLGEGTDIHFTLPHASPDEIARAARQSEIGLNIEGPHLSPSQGVTIQAD